MRLLENTRPSDWISDCGIWWMRLGLSPLRKYGAVEDKEMEQRIGQYFQQIRTADEMPDIVPLYFLITMIAVDPAERGLGHLRAMLEKLLENLKKNPRVEFILVSTYDKSKVEMYEHLGFSTLKELDNNITKAWVLKLPIVR